MVCVWCDDDHKMIVEVVFYVFDCSEDDGKVYYCIVGCVVFFVMNDLVVWYFFCYGVYYVYVMVFCF